MTRKTIVIADDDTDLTELLALRCRSRGFNVETANDGMTALTIIDRIRPDLAILDVNMPRGDGFSVGEMMSADEKLAAIPLIILTGRSDDNTIQRCYEACAYYIHKCPDVWSQVQPLVLDILGAGVSDSGGDHGASENAAAADAIPYEDSDQKIQYDWLFDLLGGPDAEPTSSTETEFRQEERSPMSEEKPWVLCIDDDSEMALGLKLRLQVYGVEVLCSFSGMDGYRNAFLNNPRAIILDFELPNGNGDYVLRRLKETAATHDIPVIVVTGRKDRNVERMMRNLGAAEFLTKPCPSDQLWQVLQQYLEPSCV